MDPNERPEDDPRDAQELSSEENASLCSGCVKCCTYITIEVDHPRAPWEYDQWVWALHHRGIELYVQKPEKWFVSVETVCEQLNAEGRCAIHGKHPVLCREYDPRTCERREPLADIRAWFRNAAEFEKWLRAERPRHWTRLEAWRRKQPQGPPKARGRRNGRAAEELIPVASLMRTSARAR